jgi:hypothetical protein
MILLSCSLEGARLKLLVMQSPEQHNQLIPHSETHLPSQDVGVRVAAQVVCR